MALGSEFLQLARTSSFQHSEYGELLRLFHEGMYGRYVAEARQIGNSLNTHEGLQLISSTTAALFVGLGVLRPSRPLEQVAGLLLCAMILALIPIYHIPSSAAWPSQELVNIGLYFCILSVLVLLLRNNGRYFPFGAFDRLVPTIARPTDTVFHLFALTLILFLVLVPEGSYGVYLLFGSRDFTHARLSILGLLPLCSLFAIYLAELKGLPFGSAVARLGSPRTGGDRTGYMPCCSCPFLADPRPCHRRIGAEDRVPNQTLSPLGNRYATGRRESGVDRHHSCLGSGRPALEASS
jgi:hypothetical protein